uniref:Uncharacterized protein n=1 Tax=Arundo donax TaxID=35708 RepID=A0A0A8YJ91_ARUDO
MCTSTSLTRGMFPQLLLLANSKEFCL